MRSPRLTTRGQSFLAAGLTISLVGMVLGFPDITRIGALLAVLPVLALVAGWRRTPQISVRRTVSPTLLRPGQSADVHLDIRNTGTTTTVLQLAEEHLDPALGRPPRLLLPDMRPGEHHQASYRVRGATRGGYRVGPLSLRQEDPFGLTTSRLELHATADVVVLPRVEELDPAVLRRLGVAGEGVLPHSVGTQGEDDASTRSYREGDDLRRIHWPATAHRGELMVRQEERHARRRAVLVLDPRPAAHRGSGEDSSFEWAVSALASAAVHLHRLGFSLVLASAGTAAEGLAREPLPVQAVLRHLALARADDGDLAGVLRAARHARAGMAVAAVADGLGEDLPRLVGVRPPGGVGLLLLLDTATFTSATVPGRRTQEAATRARAAGWHCHVTRHGESVHRAWDAVTRGERVRS